MIIRATRRLIHQFTVQKGKSIRFDLVYIKCAIDFISFPSKFDRNMYIYVWSFDRKFWSSELFMREVSKVTSHVFQRNLSHVVQQYSDVWRRLRDANNRKKLRLHMNSMMFTKFYCSNKWQTIRRHIVCS